MKFHVRYIDTSDWRPGKTGDHWMPLIDLDEKQYALGNHKINTVYSVTEIAKDAENSKIEDATYLLNKSVYINVRRLMEYVWEGWDYESASLLDYATEIATEIKTNLETNLWNPWGLIPTDIHLVVIRRVHEDSVFWLNNIFYIGDEPESLISGDIIELI